MRPGAWGRDVETEQDDYYALLRLRITTDSTSSMAMNCANTNSAFLDMKLHKLWAKINGFLGVESSAIINTGYYVVGYYRDF